MLPALTCFSTFWWQSGEITDHIHYIGNTLFACNTVDEHTHKLGDRPSCFRNHVAQISYPIRKLNKCGIERLCLCTLGPISFAH